MNWKFSQKGHYIYDKENMKAGMGCVYIAKLQVMPQTSLTKIGATTMPGARLANLGRNLRICAISRPHYNFFENEEILHEYYKKYRIPCKPNAVRTSVCPELFVISLKEIFETIPELSFETDLQNCTRHEFEKGKAFFYTKKE